MLTLPLIISAAELYSTIKNEQDALLIFDVRDQQDYLHSHIPQAQWFNRQAVNKTLDKTSGLLPDIEELFTILRARAYNPEKNIVIYNANCNPVAGRVAWTLYAFGIKNISLLNGGFDYWQQSKLPISNKVETINDKNTHFKIGHLSQPDKAISCDYQDINAALKDPKAVLLDARTPAEYKGEDVRSTYAGHIPGAININWTETKAADGLLFKPAEELHQLFKQHGIYQDSHIITYCQSHQRSALMAMLLMHLGYSYTRGYPGAWSDWGNREDTLKEV